MLRVLLVALLLALPAANRAQDLIYAHQFGTLADSLAADETVTYVTVDATRQEFPNAPTFNRAITLRRFDNASGAEEWSREIFRDPNAATSFPTRVALHPSGVYVSVTVTASNFTRRAQIRKFGRDGTAIWSTQLSTSTQESVTDVTVANGIAYAIAFKDNNQALLYALNAESGQFLFSSPIGGGGSVPRRVVADASGVYVLIGFEPLVLAKLTLTGVPVWERELLPTAMTADALFAHGTGIYAGGYSFFGQRGYLARFDSDGNRILTVSIDPSQPVLNFAEIRVVTADSSGFYVGGRFSGLLDGQPTKLPNSPSAYVRKYSFDGQPLWTKIIDEGTGTIFQWAGLAVAQGGLQLSGWSLGTFPGNPEDSASRALVARLSLPTTPLPSVSAILDSLSVAPAGGLKGRVNAICSVLDNFQRDVQRMRGSQLPTAEADLLLARIGEVREVIGCRQ